MPRSMLVGLGLQLGAFLVAYLSLRYLYAIGWLPVLVVSVPMFLASVFVLLSAPVSLALRGLLSGWVLVFPLYWLGVYLWEYRQFREEIVLVPEGYEGKLRIRFGEAAGKAEETENGRLLLRVGTDGELRTQTRLRKFSSDSLTQARNEGRVVYAVSAAGGRTRLEPDRELTGERVVVFPMGEGWRGDQVVSVEFLVGKGSTIRRLLEER